MFDVKKLESDHARVRIAIVVPKYGFSAVQRNKLKRRVRELTRQHVTSSAGKYDALLRTRRDAYKATFDELRAEIVRIAADLA